jgi:hypothetical protein
MSAPIILHLGDVCTAFHPSYANLIAAEAETGSLFALVERASAGSMSLSDMMALLWHCRAETSLSRDDFNARALESGIAKLTPIFRALIEQALGGA